MLDLILRGGKIVSPEAVRQVDLGIQDGKIVQLEPELGEASKTEINATGWHIFPGLIDAHVHFNEPGRETWEGLATGSAALAAGGGTLFFDMPLNSDPPLLSARDFHAKLKAAEASAITDFAFWGGLTPDNLDQLEDLAARGVIGFKAFMSNSGIPEFKAVDDLSLYQGMVTAAQLGLPVAVHAESEALTSIITGKIQAAGGAGIRDYLNSRPVLAELEAINRAILYAQETGCDLHIVHVSSARGLALISQAKDRGIRVSSETCPHYLHLNDLALERLGAIAKCAPPLRSEDERQSLWQAVLRGEVDIISSDHSPSNPALKESTDFFKVWGGIGGVQSTLNILLSHCSEQGLPLEKIASMTASTPAERFGIDSKGRLEPGYDADFCLVDLNASTTLTQDTLLTKHKLSPYLGEIFQGHIKATYLRGEVIYQDGKVAAKGRLIKPNHF